jgi:NAD(P)-dependent dehydrogenase (short-subunit alcohol dehydrogenase family)
MQINGAEAAVIGAAGGLRSAIARALHARGARLIPYRQTRGSA